MPSTLSTWLLSAAAATGVVGGGAVGLASAATGSHQVPQRTAPQQANVDTAQLQPQEGLGWLGRDNGRLCRHDAWRRRGGGLRRW